MLGKLGPLAVLAAGLPGTALADPVVVFAAASLTNALTEIETAFEAETGEAVVISFAGSSALARQIQQGAPADIFISASTDWMDVIAGDGLIEQDGRSDLLGNRLALVAHGATAPDVTIGPDMDLAGLLQGGRLAMALVDSVPAGIYGKAALEALGLWDSVAAQVAQADNVRAALAFVATGEAPLGIVYATDAAATDAVSVIGLFPTDTHPPIIYPVADLANRDTAAEAAFLEYLRGPQARAAFEGQGFTLLGR